MFESILHVLLHTLKESIITLPILFVCYLLIELLEERILNKYQSSKMLKGKWAPVISAGFGIIPQCGFSVVATDLYSRRVITLGSLFAIFIATSDEAIPLMIQSPKNYLNLFLILVIKLVYAIVLGLTIDFVLRKIHTKKLKEQSLGQDVANLSTDDICDDKNIADKDEKILLNNKEVEGCCKHKLEHKHNKIKEIFVHPLIHSLKIFVFILVINFVFGLIIELVGKDVIGSFMLSLGFFEPFVVTLIGLIPNCAASVVITEVFMLGGISLGSCIAGLCVNSGVAMITLFKMNKNVKENFSILGLLYILSCVLGLIINIF